MANKPEAQRMPQPELHKMTQPEPSERTSELDESTSGHEKDKSKKIGKVHKDDTPDAAQLGLHRVTDQMLSTIKASRDIERNQRNVISKLALKVNEGDDGYDDEDGDEEDEEEEMEEDEEEEMRETDVRNGNNNVNENAKRPLKTTATSLKRSKIPAPLDLSSCSSGSTTGASSNLNTAIHRQHRHGRVESAPPNVPRFPRTGSRPIGKPRVQYLGRAPCMPPLTQQGYKLKTPFMPRMAAPPWGYYPYPSYPVPLQRPYATGYPMPPRSAVPLQLPYYQEYATTPYTASQRKKQPVPATATTAVNEGDDLRETHGSQLTVEDDPSEDALQGEIRIQRNVFSFDFPAHSPAIDKKMFMSICDKVWDESKIL
ncbi:DIG2 (YDR480W) and DIG1 (YPL049C) [Zygosaccharomyces parabailii]|nr:DIG2 (YDR480W) and DIG1 (YPL049C) [Zygosaccharomyces parabailii]